MLTVPVLFRLYKEICPTLVDTLSIKLILVIEIVFEPAIDTQRGVSCLGHVDV